MARVWAAAAAAALAAVGVFGQFLSIEEDAATGVMSGRVSGLGVDQTQYRIVTYVQDAAASRECARCERPSARERLPSATIRTNRSPRLQGLFSGPFEFPSATVASDGTFNMGT